MTIPVVAMLIALAIWVDVVAICYVMLRGNGTDDRDSDARAN
jgi:hypothetical protein